MHSGKNKSRVGDEEMSEDTISKVKNRCYIGTDSLTWKDISCIIRKRSRGLLNQKSSSLSLNWWFSIYGLSSMISTANFTTIRCSFVPISKINWCKIKKDLKKKLVLAWKPRLSETNEMEHELMAYNSWKEGKPKVQVTSWMPVTQLMMQDYHHN